MSHLFAVVAACWTFAPGCRRLAKAGATLGTVRPRDSCADRVAQAVAASAPDKALDLYRQRLDDSLPQASPSA